MSKPKFKVGQYIWFRYGKDRPAPVSILGLGKKPHTYDICSLEGIFILQDVEEKYLYTTEEEAREANH